MVQEEVELTRGRMGVLVVVEVVVVGQVEEPGLAPSCSQAINSGDIFITNLTKTVFYFLGKVLVFLVSSQSMCWGLGASS